MTLDPNTSEISDAVDNYLQNARTFDRVGVEVLVVDEQLDSNNQAFAPNCDLNLTSPVPVIRDNNNADIIGSANLYRVGNFVIADIFLRYDCEERLAIEAGCRIYPSVVGTTANAHFDATGTMILDEIHINAISLGITRNADHRIRPL
jgi:hypothetical protein